MGGWGVAIFSDDLAADLKGDFTDLIGDGLSTASAVEKLTGVTRARPAWSRSADPG